MRPSRRPVLTLLASLPVTLGSLVALGAPAQAADPGVLVVNEVESDGITDWIELANPAATPVDVDGLILKDNEDSRTLAIPDGTIPIPPGGLLAVDTDVPGGFGLGPNDSARLFYPDGTTLIDGYSWTAHAAGTWSRCPSGTGGGLFDATPTKDAANACLTPTITGTATSSRPRTAAGWYSAPVTVSFACTLGSAPTVSGCPAPVTVATSGADQSVSRTFSAHGESATATVGDLDIDIVAPAAKIKGARDGKTYGAKRKPTCQADDALSGLAGCTVTQEKKKKGRKYKVTATATDNAGNATVVKLTYKVK